MLVRETMERLDEELKRARLKSAKQKIAILKKSKQKEMRFLVQKHMRTAESYDALAQASVIDHLSSIINQLGISSALIPLGLSWASAQPKKQTQSFPTLFVWKC